MPLILTPATEARMPGYTEAYISAFESSPMSQAIRPHGFTEALRQGAHADTLKAFRTSRNSFFFVVIDTELPVGPDQIVAVARWRLEDEATYEQLIESIEQPPAIPPDSNPEAWVQFFTGIKLARRDTMGSKKYWHLVLLGTNPKHGGRGAGKLALEWGLQMADKDGLECYLDSTQVARSFYEKYGFEAKRDGTVDLRPFGIDATNHNFAMVRPPREKVT